MWQDRRVLLWTVNPFRQSELIPFPPFTWGRWLKPIRSEAVILSLTTSEDFLFDWPGSCTFLVSFFDLDVIGGCIAKAICIRVAHGIVWNWCSEALLLILHMDLCAMRIMLVSTCTIRSLDRAHRWLIICRSVIHYCCVTRCCVVCCGSVIYYWNTRCSVTYGCGSDFHTRVCIRPDICV